MEEIEVKIIEIDKVAIEKKLVELGFEKNFGGNLLSLYFDFKEEPRLKGKKVLRLRNMGDKNEFTLKTKKSREGAKIMEEIETYVEDLEKTVKILENLGLEINRKDNKNRTSYKKGSVKVEIDIKEGIPPFLEIEATSVEEVHEYVEKLGFKIEDAKPWSERDLLRHYGKK